MIVESNINQLNLDLAHLRHELFTT